MLHGASGSSVRDPNGSTVKSIWPAVSCGLLHLFDAEVVQWFQQTITQMNLPSFLSGNTHWVDQRLQSYWLWRGRCGGYAQGGHQEEKCMIWCWSSYLTWPDLTFPKAPVLCHQTPALWLWPLPTSVWYPLLRLFGLHILLTVELSSFAGIWPGHSCSCEWHSGNHDDLWLRR